MCTLVKPLCYIGCSRSSYVDIFSAVWSSDPVIMYSNRRTFQALCWLLIGLQCNECFTLMTQILLMVILMSGEDWPSSQGLHSAEVHIVPACTMSFFSQRCRCLCGCREQRVISVYSCSSICLFNSLLSSWKVLTSRGAINYIYSTVVLFFFYWSKQVRVCLIIRWVLCLRCMYILLWCHLENAYR